MLLLADRGVGSDLIIKAFVLRADGRTHDVVTQWDGAHVLSLVEQLFDISPFPAVVSRLRDRAVVAVNKRTSEMSGISLS